MALFYQKIVLAVVYQKDKIIFYKKRYINRKVESQKFPRGGK